MLSCLTQPLETRQDALRFFDSYAIESRRPEGQRPTRVGRLVRMRRLLALLGDPQNRLKVIHVAGTSGKGSTCTFIEAIIRAHGYTTGLTLSPHAVDLRERFQINGAYLTDDLLTTIVKRVISVITRMEKEPCGAPGYMECLMATAYAVFAEVGVHYAVVETGVGGRTDPSNTVMRGDKLCVFTKIGKDHMAALGNRLEDIAYQKIGIVQEGNDVVIGVQAEYPQADMVLLAQTAGANTVLCIDPLSVSQPSLTQTTPYLRENAELALTACRQLAARDGWMFDGVRAEAALRQVSVPLRFELVHWQGKTFILDAAHNPQKMEALVEALRVRFPRHALAGVIAVNPDTDVAETIGPFLSMVSRLACADLVVGRGSYTFRFSDPEQVMSVLRKHNEGCVALQEGEVLRDREALLNWCARIPESMIVCTGSFHFVAVVRALLLGLSEPW